MAAPLERLHCLLNIETFKGAVKGVHIHIELRTYFLNCDSMPDSIKPTLDAHVRSRLAKGRKGVVVGSPYPSLVHMHVENSTTARFPPPFPCLSLGLWVRNMVS